jgi:hypothetical protein
VLAGDVVPVVPVVPGAVCEDAAADDGLADDGFVGPEGVDAKAGVVRVKAAVLIVIRVILRSKF